MTTRFEPAENERGSALLMSLVLIFVMTVLGLALFDLGVVESRLVYTSQADARAFEIAQAGVERALRNLQDTYNENPTDGWARGTPALCNGGGHRGCSDGRFYPAASSYIPGAGSLNFDTGSYSIEFMQVPERTLAIPCQESSTETSDVASPKKICRDLIFVRSTGTLNSPGGYSPTRTIQLLVQARLNPGTCLICGGLTGAAATGLPINGNVNIAGSIQIAGIDGTTSLDLGGGSLQLNSYATLDDKSLHRVPRLPLVCPVGRTCSTASDLVESLGGTLKVARPRDIVAVALSGGSALGQSGDQNYTNWTGPARKGKGPLDGIYIGDGCVMNCNSPTPGASFSGATLNSNVFVDGDNITKPYVGTTADFPKLTDSWSVFGVPYTHFACPAGSSCAPPTTPPTPPSGTTEFFLSRAYAVPSCAGVTTLPCDALRDSLGSIAGLTDDTSAPPDSMSAPFTYQIRFFDRNNQDMKALICWQRAGVPANTLEFGQPIPFSSPLSPTCDTPAPSSSPLLLYFPYEPSVKWGPADHHCPLPTSSGFCLSQSGFNIQRFNGPADYNFRGSAIILTNGPVKVEEIWQSCWSSGAGPCQGHQFTADSSLTVMTWGNNLDLGKTTSGVDRIMGLFYAGCDPTGDPACGQTKGILTSQRQTNIVGTAMGYRLCFAGGTSPCSSGGNVPSFFQVIPDANNLVANIGTPGVDSFTAVPVPRYWVECKGTLTLDGTLCAYTR